MSFAELKSWLNDRLRMRGDAAADIDLRRDEAPYERPLKLWKTTSGEFHNDALRAILDLVEEATVAPWNPDAFNQLALLIEAGNFWEAIRPLEALAHSTGLLKQEHGPQLRMLALRTLLALGWKGSTDFWLSQQEVIGNRWPGVIFNGLAQNDLGIAFSRLPALITDAESMRDILNLLPGIMRDSRVNMASLREMSRRILPAIPPDAAETMSEWFFLRNYPLTENNGSANPGLEAALRVFLKEDIAPRVTVSRLCKPAPRELMSA
jgi:hypothetical protein